MSQTGEVEVFRETRAILGESLVWDPTDDAILWCDITAGLLHRSPVDGPVDGSRDATLTVPPPLPSFAPAAGGGFVASLRDSVVLLADDGSVRETLARIPLGLQERLNEGKADPFGRWVTGSMALEDDEGAGSFVVVTADGVTTLIGGIGVANGLEWDDDGSRIWFTDTSVSTIYTGGYGVDGITDVDVWHAGVPHDGLTRALDGTFWGAQYSTGLVVHYAADATELETVELPAPNLTSVVLDGSGTLYVASARENLTEQQLEQHPLSGSVFAIPTSSPGGPTRRFGERSIN